MEAPARDVAVLATIALLFLSVVHVMVLARHRRDLEERLGRAHAEMDVLRHRLDDATRPPTQFARMRLRERAVHRFGRLRRAAPRRSRAAELTEGVQNLTHTR